jgi:hypothetical protein
LQIWSWGQIPNRVVLLTSDTCYSTYWLNTITYKKYDKI